MSPIGYSTDCVGKRTYCDLTFDIVFVCLHNWVYEIVYMNYWGSEWIREIRTFRGYIYFLLLYYLQEYLALHLQFVVAWCLDHWISSQPVQIWICWALFLNKKCHRSYYQSLKKSSWFNIADRPLHIWDVGLLTFFVFFFICIFLTIHHYCIDNKL